MVARFYGWDPLTIENLEVDTLDIYYQAIEILEARETLGLLRIHDWPEMKKEARDSFWKQVRSKAYPTFTKPKMKSRPESNQDIANWLKGALGG